MTSLPPHRGADDERATLDARTNRNIRSIERSAEKGRADEIKAEIRKRATSDRRQRSRLALDMPRSSETEAVTLISAIIITVVTGTSVELREQRHRQQHVEDVLKITEVFDNLRNRESLDGVGNSSHNDPA